MQSSKSTSVDAYISSQPKEAQLILGALRKIIKKTVPQAEEEILWGYPFFKYHGILAGISAYKKHVSFQVADSLQNDVRKILEDKGFTLGEKRVQIKFDQQVPNDIIKQILLMQAKINVRP